MKKSSKQLGYLTRENENEYSIWLYGAIGYDFNSVSFINDINNIPSGVTTLNLYVHSPGGLVDEGYAMLTNIHRVKNRLTVITHTDGMAFSMGSALVAAGDRHVMSPTSRLMIHNPWMFLEIYGPHNVDDIDDLIMWLEGKKVDLDNNTEVLAQAYQKRLKMPVDDILSKYFDGKNHFITPDDCLELGLCDEIAEFEINPEAAENLTSEPELEGEESRYKIAAFGEDYSEQYLSGKKVFDYNLQNHESLTVPKNSKNTDDMDLTELAKAMNINGDRAKKMSDEDIRAEVRKMANRNDTLETENKNLKQVNSDLTERKDTLETENKTLKESTVNHQAAEQAQKVIDEVEGENKGMQVNANVVDEMKARAKDFVSAESEDEKDIVLDHLKLKAQNALVTIGDDPDLKNKTESRSKGEESEKEKKYEDAQAKGEAKRKKREERLNRNRR